MVGTSLVAAWLVPAIIFLVLIVAAWLGLRWIRTEHREALRSISLFRLLSEPQLDAVLRSAHGVGFEPGATIIQQGEPGSGVFVVSEGRARVLVDGAEVATLGPGAYFGEMAVIDGGPRTATIAAQTQVATLEITPAAFLRLLDREPMIAAAIGRELRGRLAAAGAAVDDDGEAPIDRSRLVELSRQLRRTQNADWAAAPSGSRRRLRFSSLVARGS